MLADFPDELNQIAEWKMRAAERHKRAEQNLTPEGKKIVYQFPAYIKGTCRPKPEPQYILWTDLPNKKKHLINKSREQRLHDLRIAFRARLYTGNMLAMADIVENMRNIDVYSWKLTQHAVVMIREMNDVAESRSDGERVVVPRRDLRELIPNNY